MFNPDEIKKDFPILQRLVHGKPLVYLDNAATSQKPRQVIQAIVNYYEQHNANVHRGVHQLGDESTQLFHHSRRKIADFLGAQPEELVVVRNTTEALNQVAYTWNDCINEGDIILTTEMEHHSNIVPWQELAKRRNARVEFIAVNNEGKLDLDDLQLKIVTHNSKLKLVAFTHVSNTLGTVNPLEKIVEMIEENYSKSERPLLVVDGAQAAAHMPIHFDTLSVDCYAVSAHKMLGPMGIGALLIRKELLTELSPFLFGGGMINEVSTNETSFAEDVEERFTAGTPDVASLVGWVAACEYLQTVGMAESLRHDQELVNYTIEQLVRIPEVTIVGPNFPSKFEVRSSIIERIGSVAFVYQGVHAHDVGQVLDSEGVAVRSGHHCTMPLHTKFNWQATTRVSFQIYNSTRDVDQLINALRKVKEVFR